LTDYSQTISDNVGIGDNQKKEIGKILVNSSSLGDSFRKTAEFQRSVSENEGISDTVKDRWLRINVVYTIFY